MVFDHDGGGAGYANSENSKAKPIAAHLKSCGICEKFDRAVEKNSKQISESTSELSVRFISSTNGARPRRAPRRFVVLGNRS
jgi:hypothetical protein